MAYPVYYDLEDNNTTGRQSNQTIANIAQTFAQRLEQEGYYVGMYASLFWFRTKLTSQSLMSIQNGLQDIMMNLIMMENMVCGNIALQEMF